MNTQLSNGMVSSSAKRSHRYLSVSASQKDGIEFSVAPAVPGEGQAGLNKRASYIAQETTSKDEVLAPFPKETIGFYSNHGIKPAGALTQHTIDTKDGTRNTRMLYEICQTVLQQSGCDFRVYHSNMVARRVAH